MGVKHYADEKFTFSRTLIFSTLEQPAPIFFQVNH